MSWLHLLPPLRKSGGKTINAAHNKKSTCHAPADFQAEKVWTVIPGCVSVMG
jgi:hypothetical protein